MGRALHVVNGFCVGVQVPLRGQGLSVYPYPQRTPIVKAFGPEDPII